MRERFVKGLLTIAILFTVVAFLWLCRESAPVDGDTLEAWGLPRDLAGQLAHVEVLSLPPSVTSVGWLPDHLEELDVPGARIEDGGDFPANLRRLNMSYASVRRLEELPAGIEVLDARWSEAGALRSLQEKPRESLRVLLVGGGVEPPFQLPEGLYAFGASDAPFEDGSFLPRGLRELYLQGPGVLSLRALPPDLTVLSLEATRVRDLTGVPDSVTSLTIHEPPTPITVESWPPFLASLSVTVPKVKVSKGLPASLRILHVARTERVVRAEDFPPLPTGLLALSVHTADAELLTGSQLPQHLGSLDLTGFQGSRLPALPRRLSELVLAYARVEELGSLPASLLSLDLSGLDPGLLDELPAPGWPPEGLERLVFHRYPHPRLMALPRTLRHLDVSGSSKLEDLGTLPPGLERLDVSSTALTRLPDPRRLGLRFLAISGSRIDSVDGLLPDGLEELVLAPGQIRNLGRVPETLRILRFEGQARPVPSAASLVDGAV